MKRFVGENLSVEPFLKEFIVSLEHPSEAADRSDEAAGDGEESSE